MNYQSHADNARIRELEERIAQLERDLTTAAKTAEACKYQNERLVTLCGELERELERAEKVLTDVQGILKFACSPLANSALEHIDGYLKNDTCFHEWVTQRRGGSPSEADNDERVTYCRQCGFEKGED